IISERRVGSGATGVYASPSRGRLTARLDSRCNGWNKRPQIALAQWLSAKKLVACMREADGLWARASRQFLGIDDMVSRRCGAGHIISLGRLRHYVAITLVSRNAPMCVLIACLDVSPGFCSGGKNQRLRCARTLSGSA